MEFGGAPKWLDFFIKADFSSGWGGPYMCFAFLGIPLQLIAAGFGVGLIFDMSRLILVPAPPQNHLQ